MQIFSRPIGLACLVMFALPAWSAVCDVDDDGDVDTVDIRLIVDACNQPAEPGDPRDADGDGVITILDARICVHRCILRRCEIPDSGDALIWDEGNWDEKDWQ